VTRKHSIKVISGGGEIGVHYTGSCTCGWVDVIVDTKQIEESSVLAAFDRMHKDWCDVTYGAEPDEPLKSNRPSEQEQIDALEKRCERLEHAMERVIAAVLPAMQAIEHLEAAARLMKKSEDVVQ
jgi:hypothetical protein